MIQMADVNNTTPVVLKGNTKMKREGIRPTNHTISLVIYFNEIILLWFVKKGVIKILQTVMVI